MGKYNRLDVTRSRILSIRVVRTVDESPDTSTLGEFTDDADDWVIVRKGEHSGKYIANISEDDLLASSLPERGRHYRFFKPYAGGEKDGTPDYQKYGLQDWERMESLERGDWHYVGVTAKLEYALKDHNVIQTLHSGGLWGIESDSGSDYFATIAKEELDSLKAQAKDLGLPWNAKMAKAAMDTFLNE